MGRESGRGRGRERAIGSGRIQKNKKKIKPPRSGKIINSCAIKM